MKNNSKKLHILAAVVISIISFCTLGKGSELSDKEIRKVLIQNSIANYTGSCACPFNRDKAGRSCGKRSAWSKPGGASPLCYNSDITQLMVDSYRKKLKKK